MGEGAIMSKYDGIETAAELIAEVAAHGLSTRQEDINRAADIFGNTSIGELARLANDIGRNNEKGEPDPKGSWSSGRKGTQDTFYLIAFTVWNWREATAFFNQHTNPATEQARKTVEELKVANTELKKTTALREKAISELYDAERKIEEVGGWLTVANERAEAAELEVTKLKAKLYDYMTREEQIGA